VTGARVRAAQPRLRAAPALWCVALGLALIALGGLFAATPLYPGGVAFVLAGVGSCAWVMRAGAGASVSRELASQRVIEGEPLRVRVQARCSRGPLPGGELRDPLLPRPVRVPPGHDHLGVPIEARFARRGLRVLAAPRLLVRDPLALATRPVLGTGPDRVLVLPRTEPVRWAARAASSAGSGLAALLAPAAGSELDGLRPYREGAPASRIHWQALARGSGLFERQLRSESERRPLVALDARDADGHEGLAALDAAVRAAASLCLALGAIGGCALLLPGERRARWLAADLAGWPSLHARLALVQACAAPPSAGVVAAHTGVVFQVCARAPRASRAAGVQRGRVLVVAGGIAGRAGDFEVSGCTGYLLDRARRKVARAAA
jgi:uncharacterized protein (DUF58 family)